KMSHVIFDHMADHRFRAPVPAFNDAPFQGRACGLSGQTSARFELLFKALAEREPSRRPRQSTGALDDAPVDDDARLDFFADRKIDDIILSASRAGPPLSRSHRRRARIDDYRRMSRVAVFGARPLLIRRGAN